MLCVFIECPDIQRQPVKAFAFRLCLAKSEQRRPDTVPTVFFVHTEFLDVIETPGTHIGGFRPVNILYNGKAADFAAKAGDDHIVLRRIKQSVDALLQLFAKSGTEDIRASFCVQLTYRAAQLVNARQLIGFGITYRQIHTVSPFQKMIRAISIVTIFSIAPPDIT